jgi:hypothetical protein
MHQPMMDAAQRDREFVVHLAAERARLGKLAAGDMFRLSYCFQ